MNVKKLAILGLALLFIVSTVLAQRNVATIVGTVHDEDDLRLPGATVTVTNVNTGLTQSVVTNPGGQYRIERLPRGMYEIVVTLPGFKTYTKKGFELSAGAEIKVDFTLQVGAIEEEVTVIGQSPIIETTRSQVSTVMTEKDVMSYPSLDRNFFTLMEFAPGTQPMQDASGDNFRSGWAVNGQRDSSNNLMLDGLDNNDNGTATDFTTTIPPEAIQEFRLITNNFSAEYGRNTGGVLNVVMKSGTNDLHGSAWAFHRGGSSLFQSADWLTKERPPYKRWQYGATIGGPIIKDKTFFFGTFEGINEKAGEVTPYFFFTPEAITRAQGAAKQFFDQYGADYPVPTYDFRDFDGDGSIDVGKYDWDGVTNSNGYKGGLKLDHIFSERDRVALRWMFNTYKDEWDFANVPGTTKETPYNYHTGGLTWLHIFSSSMYNEVRVGFHRDWADWPRVAPELPLFGGATYDEMGDGTHTIGDWANMPQKFINNQWQVVDVLNFQAGNHSIKVGGELRLWNSDSTFDANVDGAYYFYYSSLDFLYDNGADSLWLGADPPDDPSNPYGEWKRGVTARKWKGTEAGVFIQDDWRVSDRLTLAFGIRWEYYGVPKETSGVGINMPAFGTADGQEGTYNEDGIRYLIVDGREKMGKGLWNPYYKAFAPKISFAYDLTGDGKTSLRAGFGRSYDRTFNNIYENDRFNFPDFCFAGFFPIAAPINPTIPASIPIENLGYVSYGLRWMLPDLIPASAWNWLIGIQRELTPNTALEINYSGSIGRNLGVVHRSNRFTGDRLDGYPDGLNPYFAITNVNIRAQTEKSEYHSVTATLNKRFAKNWSMFASYTYGVAKDHNSDYFGDDNMEAVSQERLDMEWGYAAFDHRHRMVGGVIWDMPFFKDSENWFVKNIVAGWQISTNFHWTSPRAFNVRDTAADFNYDYDRQDRPIWTGGDFKDVITWEEGRPYLDSSLFETPEPPEFAGTPPNEWSTIDMSYYDQNFIPRMAFRWFPTYSLNVGLQKHINTAFGSRDVQWQFIVEVFNLLKNTFWDLPETRLNSGAFGESFRQSGERRLQLSIRVLF
ncbi:TonB-dependent receptor domain-containing protein [Acidobacteriota bacterium]